MAAKRSGRWRPILSKKQRYISNTISVRFYKLNFTYIILQVIVCLELIYIIRPTLPQTTQATNPFQLHVNIRDETWFSINDTVAPCTSFPCFEEFPTSSFRPRNQFLTDEATEPEDPVLTILTVTSGPNLTAFAETTKFMRTQALKPIRWVIVCDHVSDVMKYRAIRAVTEADPRFVTVNNTGAAGVTNTRNAALHYFRKHPTPYMTFIDDDDQMELTAYEKLVWVLESNSGAAMSLPHSMFYGADAMTWDHGFRDGARNLHGFYLTITVLLRASAVQKSGCDFNSDYNTGMEDWDFFLCVASSGLWGVDVREFLFWYLRKPAAARKARWPVLSSREGVLRRKEIISRYEYMKGQFPAVKLVPSHTRESVSLQKPFGNRLSKRRGVLLIIPNEAEAMQSFYVELLQAFALRKWAVTVFVTGWDTSSSYQPHVVFQRYTHDVFVIPTFLRLADLPRFTMYIIESRLVTRIVLGNTPLGYDLLPIIKEQHQNIPVVDIALQQHVFTPDDGYYARSNLYGRYIEGTVTNFGSAVYDARVARVRKSNFVLYYDVTSTMQQNGYANATKVSDSNGSQRVFSVVILCDMTSAHLLNTVLEVLYNLVQQHKFVSKAYGGVEIVLIGDVELNLSHQKLTKLTKHVGIRIPGNTDELEIQKTVAEAKAIFFLSDRNVSPALFFSLVRGTIPVVLKGSPVSSVLLAGTRAGIVLHKGSNSKGFISEAYTSLRKLFCEACRKKLAHKGRLKARDLVKSDTQVSNVVSWILDMTVNPSRADGSGLISKVDAFHNMVEHSDPIVEFPGFYNKILNESFQ